MARASLSLRIAYVINAAAPLIAIALGAWSFSHSRVLTWPIVLSIWLPAGLINLFILFRSYRILSNKHLLDAFIVGTTMKYLRMAGVFAIYAGASTFVLSFLWALLAAFLTLIGKNDMPYLAGALPFVFLKSLGYVGIFLFELSRLMGFEKNYQA